MKSSNTLYGVFFLCLTTLCTVNAQEQQIFRFASSSVHPFSNPERTGFEDQLLKQLFQRLQLQVEIVNVPAERNLRLVNEGINDGALSRNLIIAQVYPNIMPLTESTYEREYVAFSRHFEFATNDWNSLNPYRLGIVTGWKLFEQKLIQHAYVLKVRHPQQLMQLLSRDRIDIALLSRIVGQQIIQAYNLKGIRTLSPPLAKNSLYFFLNKKHAALVVKLSDELRRMKEDGSYQALYDEILANPLEKE